MTDRSTPTPPVISVVVPVLNEGTCVGELLDSIKTQDFPATGFEVLVADGGSTDDTIAVVSALERTWPQLRLLENPRRLSSAGRNVGLGASRGRYILFLDGHCRMPHADYLKRVVELFEMAGTECLSRPQPLNKLTAGNWSRAIAAARHSWLGHDLGSDIYSSKAGPTNPRSAGAAYLSSALKALGGFDERFDACEDVELNHRASIAGYRSYRHPDLAIHYRPRSSLAGLYRQMFRYGRGRARLLARHPRVVPWPLVILSGAVISAIALVAVAGQEFAAPVLIGTVGAWLAVVLIESIRLGGLTAHSVRISLAFEVIFIGLLFGFWRGVFESRRFRSPKADLSP